MAFKGRYATSNSWTSLYKCILEECTAVLCYNDVTAMMLISYISKNGINVPSDISVVGIDNSELAKFGDLTSIAP